MATVENSTYIYCENEECGKAVCKGHLAILQFQSTSNTYKFTIPQNNVEYHFSKAELEGLLFLLEKLNYRTDTIKL